MSKSVGWVANSVDFDQTPLPLVISTCTIFRFKFIRRYSVNVLLKEGGPAWSYFTQADLGCRWYMGPFSQIEAHIMIIEPAHDKTYNKTYVTSKDSDWHVHLPSMAKIFVNPSFDSQKAVEGACDQRRLWSDCADAQADQNLCWSHKSYCRFCRVPAHYYIRLDIFTDTILSQAVKCNLLGEILTISYVNRHVVERLSPWAITKYQLFRSWILDGQSYCRQ